MIRLMKLAEPEHYYKMPPVGMTETYSRVGMEVHTQQTIRCGNKECWFVGHAANVQDAQLLLDQHPCPQPPARNELPSGYSTLEKMWDELDAVTYAIMQHEGYASGTVYLENNLLRGYARGIAFSLSMMSHPHFRTVTDIVREATKRYKIRMEQIPFEPTPGYRYNPLPPPSPPPGERSVFHGKTVETKPGGARKATGRRVASAATLAKASKVDMRNLDNTQADQIRVAYSGGFFSREELANMYKVTVETIEYLTNS